MPDNPQSNNDDPALDEMARRIAHELIVNYQWALISEDELAVILKQSGRVTSSSATLARLAKNYYSRILYEACRQTDDRTRQEQSYRELHRFLYRSAYRKRPDLAEDATQQALILVFEKIDHCYQPDTFLMFALFKLRHAYQLVERNPDLKFEVDDMTLNEDQPTSQSQVSDLEWQECLKLLIDHIKRLLNKRQQRVILLKFFGGLSDREIGLRLNISEGNVRVLRHRALDQLRQDTNALNQLQICL